MIFPRMWNMARPGFLIPVFFLSFFPGSGQITWGEAAVTAAGGCFTSRSSLMDAGFNQASLGWVSDATLSMHHTQPFLIGELAVSAISFQGPLQRGGFGTALSTFGITGLRQISSWTGYGLPLSPGITAGMGLYFQDIVTQENGHHFGLGCGLGVQMKIGDALMLGAHVKHPFAWAKERTNTSLLQMMISAGFSYTFFNTGMYHTGLHFGAAGKIRWSHGLEIKFTESVRLLLGVYNAPSSITGGISMKHGHWNITMASAFCIETGSSPGCSIAYTW